MQIRQLLVLRRHPRLQNPQPIDQLALHGRQQPGHHRMAGQGGVGGHEGQGVGEGRADMAGEI